MARIRSIKPELPQSQSMGRVSRDARLLFVLLWTVCDDAGKARGSSRMLASLLFPYDDDAPSRIGGWLDELEGEGCIERYEVAGNDYLRVCNWQSHQKIDRPSKSRIPDPREPSRTFASPRESSSEDRRIKDQGGDQYQEGITLSEGVREYARARETPAPEPDPSAVEAMGRELMRLGVYALAEAKRHRLAASLVEVGEDPVNLTTYASLVGGDDPGTTARRLCAALRDPKKLDALYDRAMEIKRLEAK